jgi:hypothetical protein
MGQRLASSKERRLQTFRRELVVDLVTHHGQFWEQVDWIRRLQRVEAEPRMPPPLDPGKVHFPDWLRPTRGAWRGEHEEAFHEWMVLLNVLHDAVVPKELRVETPYSYSLDFWMGFLSACLVYDPPPDNLLRFAEHGVAAYGDFVNPFNPWIDSDGPEMLAAPISFLPDPGQLIAEEQERHDWVIGRLQEALDARAFIRRGEIDLSEMAAHFEFLYQSVQEETRRQRNEMPSPPVRPYITVDVHTTEEDVRNAFRMMAANLPARPRPARPKRDPLLCLQCALWYDQCGWSQERIAQKMGWAIQRPPDVKPRSETARQYIADGRLLLNQRNVAA